MQSIKMRFDKIKFSYILHYCLNCTFESISEEHAAIMWGNSGIFLFRWHSLVSLLYFAIDKKGFLIGIPQNIIDMLLKK